MPLSGIHVIAGNINEIDGPVSLHTAWTWSQTLASGQTTDNAMPAIPSAVGGAPAFLLQVGVDGWISVGPTPNASASPRRWVRSGEDIVLAGNVGDKVAFLAA